MLEPLRALWERLSSLGIDAQSVGEQRRIRLTNQSAIIGSVSCGSFAAVYALAGARFFAPMIANLAAVAALIAALFLSKRGARTLSRVAVLVPVNLVVVDDLWGDTVNTASRMESSGAVGEIQVTREVFNRLEGQFEIEPRGLIQVKGKGEMETYLLKGEGRPASR